MTTAFVQGPAGVSAINANQIQISFSQPVVAGNLIDITTVAFKSPSPPTVTGISDNLGNKYKTNDANTTNADITVVRIAKHHGIVTIGGNCTITVDFSANADLGIAVNEFRGCERGAQPEARRTANDTGTSVIGARVDPRTGGDVYVAALSEVTTTSETVTPTWGTERQAFTIGGYPLSVQSIENSSGSQTPTWTLGSADAWAEITVAYAALIDRIPVLVGNLAYSIYEQPAKI